MATGTITKPYVPYTEGTWTIGSDPKCTLSEGNLLWRDGDTGFAKIVITAWDGGSTSATTRTLYTNISILPKSNISYGIILRNNTSIQTGSININTNGNITLYNDGAFTGGIVRVIVPFACN